MTNVINKSQISYSGPKYMLFVGQRFSIWGNCRRVFENLP